MAAETIALSLVSHTNVGKTTLARTLLGRDVGEVRDAPHVTEWAEQHELLHTADGQRLTLWDTPGFGDSTRLLQRLHQQGNPLGWLLSSLWDRWRDRPFWASQQVAKHLRDHGDVVLYLVNASEADQAMRYVEAEMALLDWVQQPVLVLLNQLGPPRATGPGTGDDDDLRRWREALARWPQVRQVLPLDAFARCWVQEGALWAAVQAVLPPPRQPAMAALQQAWAQQRLQTYDAAMQILADSLGRLAAARVPLDEDGGARGGLRRLGAALGVGSAGDAALDAADRRLSALVDEETRASTDALIRLHGLDGRASGVVLKALGSYSERRRRVEEGPAALLGGLLSGAATGLAADVATGGLTLGGGMLAGAVVGALGAAGVARGLNVVRGIERSWAAPSAEVMQALLQAALLRYLAVAHFGRGRGQWRDGEAPPHWLAAVDAELARLPTAALWAGRARALDNPGEAATLAAALRPLLADTGRRVLDRLYPGAWAAWVSRETT